MSVLTALYKTYNSAFDQNMVDQVEQLNSNTVLLPVYHSSKKSTGTNDMIEVTLSENSEFIKAEWVPKDQIAIYPVTENSIIRAGKVIAPHALCDEFSYLSRELDTEKNKVYESVLSDWVSFMEEGRENHLLKILANYLLSGTILKDCINSLFQGMDFEISSDYSVSVGSDDKTPKLYRFDKVFVTFQVETIASLTSNLSVSTSRELHLNYIEYIRDKNKAQAQEQCDISGETTYCVSRHRGLMGNAKLVSISNHDETYYGRFDNGEEVVHIGYEVSQKIHLMLKYLLENSQNRKTIGSSCVLVNWFSDDIDNEEAMNLTQAITPSEEEEIEDEEEDEEYDEEYDQSTGTLGGKMSSDLNDHLTGTKRDIDPDSKFYIMILDKISNGRIAVKYFRELSKSDLYERVQDWYKTTSWLYYNSARGRVEYQTPSLYQFADTVFGMENSKGFMECRNSKLKTKTIERLLPCILDHRKLPLDMKNRMLENLCHRNSYDKTWNYVLLLGCTIFKKYQIDYQNRSEVNPMLDHDKQTRSYLYGRLLAVYEKLEEDAMKNSANGGDEKRSTNAERLWTAYTKMPERTVKVLEEKIRPYKERLKKSNFGLLKKYDIVTTELMNQLSELKDSEKEKNRALNEDFVFGYYAQKQNFYTKKDTNEPKNNEEQIEGGN